MAAQATQSVEQTEQPEQEEPSESTKTLQGTPDVRPEIPELQVPDELIGVEPLHAVATVQFWADALTYGRQSGDYSFFDDVTGTECDSCYNLKTAFYQTYGEGSWSIGGKSEPIIWGYNLEEGSGSYIDVYFDWVQFSQIIFDASDQRITAEDINTGLGNFMRLKRGQEQWEPIEFGVLSNSDRLAVTQGYSGTALSAIDSQITGTHPFPRPEMDMRSSKAEAAMATVKNFFYHFSLGYEAGNGAEARALSGPGCEYCINQLTQISGLADSKIRIKHYIVDAAIKDAILIRGDEGLTMEVFADIIVEAFRGTDQNGAEVLKFPTDITPGMKILLTYRNEMWHVDSVSQMDLDAWLDLRHPDRQ